MAKHPNGRVLFEGAIWNTGDGSLCSDWNQVSTWAADSFCWAAFDHIFAYTYDGGRLYRPLAPATRAETAYAMHVLCEQCD